MATGRRLDDLLEICPFIELFSYVIAENGALLYEPKSRKRTLLAEPLPGQFIEALKAANVSPIEIGNVIAATQVPNQEKVLEIIRELGLELKITFNRSAVMVLPVGINKASGTKYALRKLGMSPHEIVAVGDSENDHSLLHLAECPVAVANALDAIKEAAAFVTPSAAGEGVVELIDKLIGNDLKDVDARLNHRHIALGTRLDGTVVRVSPYGPNILVAGPSGSGKSTWAAGFIERLIEKSYQVCIVDSEGDYVAVQTLVTIGDQGRAPTSNEILGVLQDPDVNVNVNLLGVPLIDRPHFSTELFLNLQAMRARTGRPHWLVLEKAHHLLPATWGKATLSLPQRLGETLLITVHPDHVAPAILSMVDVAIAVGQFPIWVAAEMRAGGAYAHSALMIVEADESSEKTTAGGWSGCCLCTHASQVMCGSPLLSVRRLSLQVIPTCSRRSASSSYPCPAESGAQAMCKVARMPTVAVAKHPRRTATRATNLRPE